MAGIKTLLVLAALLQTSWQRSTAEDDSYVAAVVEFEVTRDSGANLQSYVQLIQEAAEANADVVVFPEMTLTRGNSVIVPINGLLKEYPVPALNPSLFDEYLVTLSGAARNNQIYVVVNVEEIMNCTTETSAPGENCPEEKSYLFNTNVVFDRNGSVIDRYRKIHLFGEFSRYPALEPDLGVFETDFGVTFGHFICFDLMFQVPAVQIVQKLNLTDIIFTTMWFSEMPYLSATQIQESYAYTMNVNMLASGANNVRVGSAGSGIYSGKAGALISVMPGVPTTRLLVHKVPKTPGQISDTYPGHIPDDPRQLDELLLITDPSLPSHASRLLTPGSNDFVLTDKQVRCHFRVKLNERSPEFIFYRAVVQDSANTYSHNKVHQAVCSLVACKSTNFSDCAHRFTNEEPPAIEELEITMVSYGAQYNDTLKCDDVIYYPVSFTNRKFPLQPKEYTFKIITENANEVQPQNGRTYLNYRLNIPGGDIISLGIYGRIYNKDVDGYKNLVVTDDLVQNYNEIEDRIYNANEI